MLRKCTFPNGVPVALVALALCLLATTARSQAPCHGPRVVFVIGEGAYRTEETLPAFAERELAPLGFRTTIVRADAKDKNHFPGIEALKDADLLVLSVRRRTLPEAELALIRGHLEAGKPLVAIRTASHAFTLGSGAPSAPAGHAQWPHFDVEVLGGHYAGDLGNKDGTDITPAPGALEHPILTGVTPTVFHSAGSLYKSVDLGPDTHELLLGRALEKGKTVSYPVAWTNTFKKARVFYTSLGHPDDFQVPAFNRILVNAIQWVLAADLPGKQANAAPAAAGRDRYKEGLAANEQVEKMIRGFAGKGVSGRRFASHTRRPCRRAVPDGGTLRDATAGLRADDPSAPRPDLGHPGPALGCAVSCSIPSRPGSRW